MRTSARNAATVTLIFAGLSMPAVAASAATPVLRACVGQTLSAAATGSPAFGRFVSGVAHDPTSGSRVGVGDDLQALAAGVIPDSDFVNTCNN